MKIKDLQNMLVEAQDKPGPMRYLDPPGGGGGGGNQGGGGFDINKIRPFEGPELPNWWEITGTFGDELVEIFGNTVIELINDAIYGVNYPVPPGGEGNQNLQWQTYEFTDQYNQTRTAWGFVGSDGTVYVPSNLMVHGFGWWPASQNADGSYFLDINSSHPNFPTNWPTPVWNGPDLGDMAYALDPDSGLPGWIVDPDQSGVFLGDLVAQGYLPNWILTIQEDVGLPFDIEIEWVEDTRAPGIPPSLVIGGQSNPLGAANLVWSTAAGRWIIRDSPGSLNYWDASSPAVSLYFYDPDTGKRATYGIDRYDYVDDDEGSAGDTDGPNPPDDGDPPVDSGDSDSDPGGGNQDGDSPDTDPDGDGDTPSKWSTSPGQSDVDAPRVRGNIDWDNILKALIKGSID